MVLWSGYGVVVIIAEPFIVDGMIGHKVSSAQRSLSGYDGDQLSQQGPWGVNKGISEPSSVTWKAIHQHHGEFSLFRNQCPHYSGPIAAWLSAEGGLRCLYEGV